MATSGEKESVGLKVNVPLVPGVISAEVPIRWSLLRPLLRLFRKVPLLQESDDQANRTR